MTYSVGWPVEARTTTAIGALRDTAWTAALATDRTADEHAQVADLTGLLRTSVGGDQLATWPAGMPMIARRTPRDPGEPGELGSDANWRYGAFATNTTTGQVQFLDARHRTQAHVEDKL